MPAVIVLGPDGRVLRKLDADAPDVGNMLGAAIAAP
jgi:hypothetical protein